MGCLLYPKHLKALKQDAVKVKTIDKIHQCFQVFSLYKLDYLNSFDAYKVIFSHFITLHKEDIIKESPTISKAQKDFESAFEYMEKFYLLKP